MTSRELPVDEWPRLDRTSLAPIWPQLSPGAARVAVVEEGGEILGSWGLMAVAHAECVEIAAAHRGRGAVARRLWLEMRRMVQEAGLRSVVTAADDPAVAALILKHGGVRLAPHYLLPFAKGV